MLIALDGKNCDTGGGNIQDSFHHLTLPFKAVYKH